MICSVRNDVGGKMDSMSNLANQQHFTTLQHLKCLGRVPCSYNYEIMMKEMFHEIH